MLSRFNATQKGILIAIAGFAAFVVSDSCAKWLAQFYSIFEVIVWLYAAALVFCMLAAQFLGGWRATLRSNALKFHLARGAMNVGLAVTVVLAFQNLPLTSTYPVFFLSPFIMTVLAGVIYKERVSARDWGIIALGFSGVLIAFRPGIEILNPWLLVALVAAFFIAGFGLLARKLEGETLLSLAFYPSIANVVVLSPFLGMPAPEHLPVILLAGLCVSFGMMCVAYAYRLAPYAVISPLQYLQLVMAFGVGFVVFGERPDGWMIAGSLVIVASGVMLAVGHRHKENPPGMSS
jgi:drug/metabolite transporter (DMT)-like permease